LHTKIYHILNICSGKSTKRLEGCDKNRLRHCNIDAEKAYLAWIKRVILHIGKKRLRKSEGLGP